MEALVATIISIVGPYLAKGGEEFAKQAGSAAFDGAKKLVARLSQWWSGAPVAEAAAKALPSNPEKYAKILGSELAEDMAKNPELSKELRQIVDGMGPSVELIQKIEIARGVTGADISAMVQGHVNVTQEIRSAENVTGVKIGQLGR
jgi:hypothetical protein